MSDYRSLRPSRRVFLRGAAGAALALPFLESLLPRHASGQVPTAPKRFIVLKSFSTQLVKEWYPAFTGNGYQLKDSKYSDSRGDGTTLLTQKISGTNYTWAPLGDFKTDTGISGILGPKLNPFLSKLTLIRGLDFLPAVNHNYGGLLGNFASCTAATPCDADSLTAVPTIDQVMAYSSKVYPSTPSQRYLHISQGVTDSMSYSDLGMAGSAVEQLKARTNPLDAFNDVFGTNPPESSGMPASDRDKLLVDRVYADYVKLKSNSRLSGNDKDLVEKYVNLVAELQAKLSVTPTMSCTLPATPASLANNSGLDAKDITTKWDLFLDVVTAAVMCDRTRVITLGVHKALGPGPDSSDSTLVGHYHSEDASGGTWHGLAHDWDNANSRRMLQGINSWIAAEVFAKLLSKLDVPEVGDSTYLDNSLVYWGNELGFNHIAYSVPCVLAGGAGGYIKTGRYLDYIDWNGRAYFSQEDGNVIQGIPHNQFLVTALQAMGLSPADYERNGQKGYGSTNVSGRTNDTWAVDYDLSKVGDVLPGIQG